MNHSAKLVASICLIASIASGGARAAKGTVDVPALHITPARLFVDTMLRTHPLGIAAFSAGDFVWLTTLRSALPAYSVTFLDRDGKEIGRRGVLHDEFVPLDAIPEHFIKATLAIEDRDFFTHYGINFAGILRTIATGTLDSDTMRGSTLTQQLAKNVYLASLASERWITRKFWEVLIVLWLEARATKREILAKYFDRAYLGGNTIGIEAASQYYFGKSVRDIDLAESALLAGLFSAPTKYSPHGNPEASRRRSIAVLDAMVEAGFVTKQDAQRARLKPAKVLDRRRYDAPDYFLDWAFEETQRLTKDKGEYRLSVRTTLETRLQKAAESVITETLSAQGQALRVSEGALVSMENDGAVRALVGGRDHSASRFNRAVHAKRQPGSAMQSFAYLLALEGGATSDLIVPDSTPSCGNWTPKNYDVGDHGKMTLTSALAMSVNTVAVRLSLEASYGARERLLQLLDRLGLGYVRKTCSMALGDQGVTVMDLTSAYATLASGGKRVKGYAIIEIRDRRGKVIYARERDEPHAAQVLKRDAVEALNRMLQNVIEDGTGKSAQLDFAPAAGKTGTSLDYKDAWFLGFTGTYTTGVWFGNDNFTAMIKVTGGMLAASTWKTYNDAAHKGPKEPQIPGVSPGVPDRSEKLPLNMRTLPNKSP